MLVRHICGDRRTAEVKFCQGWLEAAAKMREHLYEDGNGFDPFRYNETATVGFLVAAAGRAGHFALPEFTEYNRKLPKGRVRAGRCDMWLASSNWELNWLIEFKLGWYGPYAREGLITPMNAAIECAFNRDRVEADERWACVVYAPGWGWTEKKPAKRKEWRSHATVDALAQHVDIAFEIGGASAGPAHILLKKIPARARKLELHLLDANILRPND